MANKRRRSWTVTIEFCLSFNFAVVIDFNIFLVLPSKAQFLGDVPINRQNAANCTHLFRLILVFCVIEGDRDSEEEGDSKGDGDGEGEGDGEGDEMEIGRKMYCRWRERAERMKIER